MLWLIPIGIIAILLIIDGWKNGWAGTQALWTIINNRAIRRLLRILLVIVITIGSLFIIASIGFFAQSQNPDSTGLMWLTLLPIIIAMLVIWACMISAGALEQVARGIARLFGFQISSQSNLARSWEKGFLSVAFWVYLILVFYPFWNPWTGNLHPAIMILLLFGGMALATYARWAAGAGKKPKIIGLIIVPVLFVTMLGAKYPDDFKFLGSLVNRGRAKAELKQEDMNQDSAVDDRKIKAKKESIPVIENIRLAELHDGIAPLDADGNDIALEEHEKDLVRIERTLSVFKLKTIAPKLIAYLNPSANTEFYEIKLKDPKGRYSRDSTMCYIEVTDVEREIINIPKEPEVNNPNKPKKKKNLKVHSAIIKLRGPGVPSETVDLRGYIDYEISWASRSDDVEAVFENGSRTKKKLFKDRTQMAWFEGPDGEEVAVAFTPK